MDRELMRLLFNGGPLTLGEAAIKAKTTVTDPDVRRTWILVRRSLYAPSVVEIDVLCQSADS